MIYLIYICVTSAFLVDWFYYSFDLGNRYITLVPEFISLLILLCIPFYLDNTRRFNLPTKYGVCLALMLCTAIVGAFLNQLEMGVLFSGLRQYVRFIPLFLVPFVIKINEDQLIKILKIILFVALFQVPVALYQRFVLFPGVNSGDPIGGTFGPSSSGKLSVFLLIAITFVVAFYAKSIAKKRILIIAALFLFIPTTLNETKITLLLIPVSFLLPLLIDNFSKKNILGIIKTSIISFLVGFAFVWIYNQTTGNDLLEFYFDKNKTVEYSSARTMPIIDSFKNVSVAQGGSAFGHGIGNVSPSFEDELQGKKYNEFSKFNPEAVSFAKIVYETGYLGLLSFGIFALFVVYDSFRFVRFGGVLGSVSLGMAGGAIIFWLSFFYTKTLDTNCLVYPFFLMTGLLISMGNDKAQLAK